MVTPLPTLRDSLSCNAGSECNTKTFSILNVSFKSLASDERNSFISLMTVSSSSCLSCSGTRLKVAKTGIGFSSRWACQRFKDRKTSRIPSKFSRLFKNMHTIASGKIVVATPPHFSDARPGVYEKKIWGKRLFNSAFQVEKQLYTFWIWRVKQVMPINATKFLPIVCCWSPSSRE